MTTINQETAEVSKKMEPLKTLGTYRSGKVLGWEADRSWRGLAFFGASPCQPRRLGSVNIMALQCE